MLWLRVATPADLTPAIVDLLDDDVAVSEFSVLPGVSRKPAGDVIEATVAREAANELVDRLRAMGVPQRGSIHLAPVTSYLSQAALEAERIAPGSSADTVVWVDVGVRAYEDTELNWTFLTLMSLAIALAGIAISTDSEILVIGAMVLGPEFGAVAALGLATVRKRWELLRRAVRALVVGFAVGISVTYVAAVFGRVMGWVTAAEVTADRPNTSFIYHPDRWTIMIAIIAGAAGVLSMTSSRAANLALAMAFGLWSEAAGSLLQLVLNIVAMGVAGWVTLQLQQTLWHRVSAHRAAITARFRSA